MDASFIHNLLTTTMTDGDGRNTTNATVSTVG